MTSKERAENILGHEGIDMFWDYEAALAFAIAQIDEACQEEHDRIRIRHAEDILAAVHEAKKKSAEAWSNTSELRARVAFKEGRASMREEAAKVADEEECVVTDEVNCHGSVRIAKKIRAIL